MTREIEVPVLVVGGGPIGLSLAMDLAWRGVEVLVCELRARGEPPPPKCNHVAARSMEIFRRLGVAGKLRNAGLPADYPNDISYRTAFTGKELTRIPIPCRRDRYDATAGPDTDWPTPEPPHRINQIYLEPILFDHAAQMPLVRTMNRVQIEGFSQNDDEVVTTARDLDSGEQIRIASQYMIGCDGGSSLVRKGIGATFEGDAVIGRTQTCFIRAPDLINLQVEHPAWATFSLNPRRSGNVYAIDGREKWVVHNYLRPNETDFDAVDRDWAIRTILGVDDAFQYELLSKEDWFGRRLIANKFRDRRVFIAGDAAHIWVPFAGYGMNAGIADVMNLSWILAAHLNGWAPASILDAHERERHPITEQVSKYVMNHAQAMASQRGMVPENIEDDTPQGAAARAALGQAAYELNVQQYCCAGLNFGTFYAASPIISHDDEAAPGYTMATFTASTVHGCRTPRLWLDQGRSLYDAMGSDYTLLRMDRGLDVGPLMAAAAAKNIPLDLVDLDGTQASGLYDRKLVLSRPDQHVAWRGDTLPADCAALCDLVRGAAG